MSDHPSVLLRTAIEARRPVDEILRLDWDNDSHLVLGRGPMPHCIPFPADSHETVNQLA